jgi:integral membrane protein (TIGR01906 family)
MISNAVLIKLNKTPERNVNNMVKRITDVILSLLIMLVILSASVIFTLNFRQLYYFDINYLGIEQSSGLPKDEIIENYNALIDYNSMFNNSSLEFPTLAMSEHGRIHFSEVKQIFVGFEYFFLGALVLAVVGIIAKCRKKHFDFMTLTGIFTIVIPVVLGSIIALNWDWFFITFHKIAFNNNYWLFDPATDPVINILPDAFFMHCALLILLLTLIGGAVFLIIGFSKRKRQRHNCELPQIA